MTLADQDVPVLTWNEPDGLIARGTVVVIPGREELPTVYERFGRRLLLAGLPATPQAGPAASWEEELDARTFCPAHRGRLTASAVRRGALYEPIPADWLERADLDGLGLPILGIHGSDDPISHQTHRTAAAVVVLFLERIRQDSGPSPIAVPEQLRR